MLEKNVAYKSFRFLPWPPVGDLKVDLEGLIKVKVNFSNWKPHFLLQIRKERLSYDLKYTPPFPWSSSQR